MLWISGKWVLYRSYSITFAISGQLSFHELWKHLQKMNLGLSEQYAKALFMVRLSFELISIPRFFLFNAIMSGLSLVRYVCVLICKSDRVIVATAKRKWFRFSLFFAGFLVLQHICILAWNCWTFLICEMPCVHVN